MAVIAAVMLAAIVLATDVNILLRFGSPIMGVVEVSEFLLIGTIFLTIAWTQLQGKHIRVTLVTSRFPQKWQDILIVVTNAIGIAIFVLITWKAGQAAWNALIYGETAYGQEGLYTWPARSLVPLGCGTLCIQLLIQSVEKIRKIVGD